MFLADLLHAFRECLSEAGLIANQFVEPSPLVRELDIKNGFTIYIAYFDG
jgi:hypothetical protein